MAAISNPQSVASLDHAWLDTVTEWHNPKRHDELFRLTTAHDAWVWTARRYRGYSEANPGDEIAKRQLRRISQGALLISMYSNRPAQARRGPMPYRRTISLLAMMVLALGMGSLYTSWLDRSPTAGPGLVSAEVAPEPVAPPNDDRDVVAGSRSQVVAKRATP